MKEIVKNILCRHSLSKRVKGKKTLTEIKWKLILYIKVVYKFDLMYDFDFWYSSMVIIGNIKIDMIQL